MNDLTDDERHALVLSCKALCRKLGGQAARDAGRRGESADFVATAWLACVEASRKWRPVGTAKFTTYAVAWVNRAMLAARRTLDPATSIDTWEEVGDAAPHDGPPTPLDPSPLTALHYRVLDRLKEPTREVVRLSVVEGASARQIALRLGRSVKDVKLMLRNALPIARQVAAEDAAPDLFALPPDGTN